MSKRLEIGTTTLLFLLVFWTVACSSPPSSRIEAADKALAAALTAGAERFAPELVAQARELYGGAEDEIAQQQGRRPAVRSYRRAELLLLDAEQVARQAERAARERSVGRSAEARSAVDRAAGAVESAAVLIARLPTGLDTRHEAQQMRSDLAQLRNGLAAARAAFDAGDVETAAVQAAALEARAVRTARVVARALEHLVVVPAAASRGRSTAAGTARSSPRRAGE